MPDSAVDTGTVDAIAEVLHPGALVVVADGAGAPLHLLPALAAAAERSGPVDVVLGWCLEPPLGLDGPGVSSVRGFVASNGAGPMMHRGAIDYVPVRLSTLPALFAGPWRPDVVVASATSVDRGITLGTEVSWIPSAIGHATRALVHLDPSLPGAAVPEPLSATRATVIGSGVRGAVATRRALPTSVDREIGARVARMLPEDAWLQFGPGVVGEAVLAEVARPVTVWSGVITDAVADLHARGVLSRAVGSYVIGGPGIWEWSGGRGVLDRVERTHDVTALSRVPFVSVNTALQVDRQGQIGVERVPGRLLGAVGGHPDFALAGALAPGGLSVIALPTVRGGHPTLVEALDGAVSTVRYDIDIVVTETGVADVRGLSENDRAAKIAALWKGVA